MSTSAPPMSAPASTSSGGTSSAIVNWADFTPRAVDHADSLPSKQVDAVWNKLYRHAGRAGGDEKTKRMVRAGVYVYALLNGTSRDGTYAGFVKCNDGYEFPASVIPLAIGKMEIRKFFRANMDESYDALKAMDFSIVAPRLLASAAELGISAAVAFAKADWMDDCPKFTPAEANAHGRSFEKSIVRARNARNGHSLEHVENERVDRSLNAQGEARQSGAAIEF